MFEWPYKRASAQRPAPPAPPPILPLGMAEEFHGRELGVVGEFTAARAPSPPPPVEPRPFVVEPWPEEERRRDAAKLEPAPEPADPTATGRQALAALKAAHELYDPPGPEPAEPYTPLEQERFRPPEWPAEQRRQEALERARAERGILEEWSARHPPPRREPA